MPTRPSRPSPEPDSRERHDHGAPYALRALRLRIVGVLAVVVLAVVPLGISAAADDRQDAVDKQNEAQQREAELNSSLEGVSAELGQAYIDLQNAEAALTAAEDELTAAEDDLADKEREQQVASDRLDVAQADLDALTEEATTSDTNASENTASVADLVVSTYQGDSALTSWTYVLSSDTVDDLTQRTSSLEIATSVQESVLTTAEAERAQDANRQARQDAATTRVADLKEEADVAAADAETARDDARTKRDDVASRKTEKETAAAALEDQKKDLEAQRKQAEADAAEAAEHIAEIDAANQEAYEAGQASEAPSATVPADSLGEGYIGHPIAGDIAVTSPFGYRVHPVTGVATGHQGVDFAASGGTPQYASAAGTVTYWDSASCGIGLDLNIGYVEGHSYVITLCHLSERTVADGQQVSRGDVIGLTGSTGYATGPHVHFQVAQDGVYIDPMTLPGF